MKILLVGLGGIGQRHARNLRTLLGTGVEFSAYRVRRRSDVVTPALSIAEGKS
jgi:lactate dehydrogenase-like 2-hydroxyacid dehydrogenase